MKENTPIIVANTKWDIPETLLNDIKGERMVNALIDMVTPLSIEESVGYAEVVGYMMPETFQRPIHGHLSKIYLYCVTQLMKRKKMLEAFPEKCRVEKLTDYEMSELNNLKNHIYKARGGKEKNPFVDALREVFVEHKATRGDTQWK